MVITDCVCSQQYLVRLFLLHCDVVNSTYDVVLNQFHTQVHSFLFIALGCAGKGWLEEHGRPLEAMSVDMAQIEKKNNKLDVQWRNYQVPIVTKSPINW